MPVDGDFANFRAVYDELTDEVQRATHQFLPDHIANWFRTLDTAPRVAEIIKRLESNVNYREWRHKLTRTVSQRYIEWPQDPEQALGIKLSLFRNFTREGPDDIATFGYSFLRTGQNVNANARAVVEHIFMPMARELRRYLESQLEAAPAADRVVRLDHNSKPYQDAMEALATLERVLQEANDYPDGPEEKQRVVAEVSAARRIFEATLVRVETVIALLKKPVTYLAEKFVGAGIGAAASKVVELLSTLLGSIF